MNKLPIDYRYIGSIILVHVAQLGRSLLPLDISELRSTGWFTVRLLMTVTIPGNLNKAPRGKGKHMDKASILWVLVVRFLGGLYHLGKPPFRFSRLQKKNLQTLQKMNSQPTFVRFCLHIFSVKRKGCWNYQNHLLYTSLCSLEKFASRRRWRFPLPNHSTPCQKRNSRFIGLAHLS